MRKKKRVHVHVFETPKRSASASEALSGTTSPSYMSGPTGKSLLNPDPNETTVISEDDGNDDTIQAEKRKYEKKKKSSQKRHEHIPMNEALAILEGRTPVYPKKKTFLQRFIELESLVRSDASLIALKTAAAVCHFRDILYLRIRADLSCFCCCCPGYRVLDHSSGSCRHTVFRSPSIECS